MFNFPKTNIFPALIIGLSLWASLVYYVDHKPYHGSYWLFAGLLNLCVLFMGEA